MELLLLLVGSLVSQQVKYSFRWVLHFFLRSLPLCVLLSLLLLWRRIVEWRWKSSKLDFGVSFENRAVITDAQIDLNHYTHMPCACVCSFTNLKSLTGLNLFCERQIACRHVCSFARSKSIAHFARSKHENVRARVHSLAMQSNSFQKKWMSGGSVEWQSERESLPSSWTKWMIKVQHARAHVRIYTY